MNKNLFLICCASSILLNTVSPVPNAWSLASNNIPLDSPVYSYIDKLAGLGLITTDIKGIRPYSKAEAARLLLEAQEHIDRQPDSASPFVLQLIKRIRELIPREISLKEQTDLTPKLLDVDLKSSMRMRYIYLDGKPRSYERLVNDPGDDGIFGIGSGLRPKNPYPAPVNQHGTEGTPLSENNNGTVYRKGFNAELRWAAEGHISSGISGLVEPAVLYSRESSSATVTINRGYLKLGGGAFEVEAGRDENWLGLGYRGNITLTNNAKNFTQVKFSSPEPIKLKYIGDMKYTLIFSRFDRTVTSGVERQPWFYALKLSFKPTDNLEIGCNLGRQVGGPGVNNSIGATLRGLIGGTSSDNSNGLGGIELRYRIPWLRNTELYGEFSDEDMFLVESYVAGIYIPRLTNDGRNDFRFEFFQGNNILYTNGTFPKGYNYNNMPIGHSQGGGTRDYYCRFSHWFNARNNLALEYFYTTRGDFHHQLMPGQIAERKHAGRISWNVPIFGDIDAKATYGYERIWNLNLVEGEKRTNQIAIFELRYKY